MNRVKQSAKNEALFLCVGLCVMLLLGLVFNVRDAAIERSESQVEIQ